MTDSPSVILKMQWFPPPAKKQILPSTGDKNDRFLMDHFRYIRIQLGSEA